VTRLPFSVTLTRRPLRPSRVTFVVAVPVTLTIDSARVSTVLLSSMPAITAYRPSGTLNARPEFPTNSLFCTTFSATICDARATPVRPSVVTSSFPVAAFAGTACAATASGATSSVPTAETRIFEVRRTVRPFMSCEGPPRILLWQISQVRSSHGHSEQHAPPCSGERGAPGRRRHGSGEPRPQPQGPQSRDIHCFFTA